MTFEGIDANDPGHKNYLSKMTSDFTNRMITMIHDAVEERRRTETGDNLTHEVVNHTIFCKNKLENFYGREKAQEVQYHYELFTPFKVLLLVYHITIQT